MAQKELDHSNEVFSSDVNDSNIKEVDLVSTMRSSFLDYSMSVIVSRALPEVRDGLKPVHRRIVYAMNDLSMTYQYPHKKSARIVGEVIGKYHPHGDVAVYDAMARLAQPFNTRYPLVDGHGNFGSIDGDEPAAMRYTEARLSKIASEIVRDINKNTVDFVPNYDGEEKEPTILPCRIPNILVNGSTGIAVGMATNIPPHNLNEVIDAALAVEENPDISVTELITKYIYGPDFPTGGIILGKSGIKQAYETGSGIITVRSKCEIEDDPHHKDKKVIIVSEIPYAVNKAQMIERIGDLVRNKVIEGISDIRDESNKEGIRIVVEVKKDEIPEVILNQLFKYSQLQSQYSINMLAIYDGQPKIFPIKEILKHYMDHQVSVIRRRTQYDLDRALERVHILNGLKIASQNIDEVIAIIKKSKSTEDAQNQLMTRFALDEIQCKAILEMQLRRLTGIEQDKIIAEIDQLNIQIAEYRAILASHEKVIEVIRNDLMEIKKKYGDERRTELSNELASIEDEDLIPQEDVVITLTNNGYVKRVPVDTYKLQNRGGVGVKGITTHDDDVVDKIITTTTHSDILFFSELGRVFRIRGYQIPEFNRQGKGTPVVNLLPGLPKEEKIKSLISITEGLETDTLLFISRDGIVKRTMLNEFDRINKNGKIAVSLKEGDTLFDVKKTDGNQEVYIASDDGKVCRFIEDDVRVMGRSASGVKGIELNEGARVVGATTSNEGKYILVVSENGLGKMSDREDYRLTKRGSKGVTTMNVTDKTGLVASIKAVEGNEDILVTTTKGTIIRTSLEQVKVAGRNTQGVKIIKMADNTKVATVTTTPVEEEN